MICQYTLGENTITYIQIHTRGKYTAINTLGGGGEYTNINSHRGEIHYHKNTLGKNTLT